MFAGLFLAGVLLLLLIISGAYVFVVACLRSKEMHWLVREEIEKTPYGKYYESIVCADKWLQDHMAQDVYISSYDGLRLHAFWIPVENAKGTVLFAHGYHSTYLVDFGPAMELYHKQGMNLLIPDQRCHGKSEGRFITFGVKESRDMISWLEYHNLQLGSWQVILSGISMGASTMIYLADEYLPRNVKGIIADCGFTSPKEILASVFTRITHLPAAPTLWFTGLFTKMLAGFGLSEKNSRITLSKNRLPILMVHGTKDDFVPCKMTVQGYKVCTGPKQLLLVEGAGHGTSFLVDSERYIDTINKFLYKNLEGFLPDK